MAPDVPVEAFVGKVKEVQPDLPLLSALLTTTMPNQQKTPVAPPSSPPPTADGPSLAQEPATLPSAGLSPTSPGNDASNIRASTR
jgi:hypothetical protein